MLSETLRYLRRIEQMQGFFTSLFSAQCVMSLHDTPKDENRVEISRSSDGLRNIAVFFRSFQNLHVGKLPEATGRADCRLGGIQFFRPAATPKMRSANSAAHPTGAEGGKNVSNVSSVSPRATRSAMLKSR